jgi:Holliday junction resolvase
MLALAFHAQGFRVTKNPIGVPDILAIRDEPRAGFAVEAKTSEDGRVSLQERELDALLNSGLMPTVAILAFPDPEPRWIFVDARTVAPATYELIRLARHRQVELDFDVNLAFRSVVAGEIEAALERPDTLDDLLDERKS